MSSPIGLIPPVLLLLMALLTWTAEQARSDGSSDFGVKAFLVYVQKWEGAASPPSTTSACQNSDASRTPRRWRFPAVSMRVSGVSILWDDPSHQEVVLPRVARLMDRITSSSGLPVYPELGFWRVRWNQWGNAAHFS